MGCTIHIYRLLYIITGLTIQLKDQNDDKVYGGVITYIAPEVLLGRPFTQVVDIYSLGIIMSEIMTGRRAFDGEIGLISGICQGEHPKFAPGTISSWLKDA
ncbi:hypothetical protein C2G38_2147323 [Gigaspora rosea]|uniref:Protein kinase domain-containing protein n=1 Tax=Gigaspora rosea TaxID=44941 RepID=A0A397UCM6_9GLOM|nr:hypothetical protein C2G38_2147323 [Gigaspora rosea]